MDNTFNIVLILLFGAIGLGFFTYGRKQQAVVPLFAGIALIVFPYFIPNLFILIITGIAIVLMPYFIKI